MKQTSIPCSIMRGGTSKGVYLLSRHLPSDIRARDAVLMALLGTPDVRQIDGLGGAHPLTSKVAIVSPPTLPGADADYLFLQLGTAEPVVSDSQTCGNLLAGVGAFAIEMGLVDPMPDTTDVRVHMVNTSSLAVVRTPTPDRVVEFAGVAKIDGVPGTAAPVLIDFLDIAGGSCGALLPTGNLCDTIEGIDVTLIDNGMPVVIMRAADFGLSGYEMPEELEANKKLRESIEAIRLAVGPLMNLGDVKNKSVPKMCLVAPPAQGGTISTRNFIPHRVHDAIGVFGAVSVATACALAGSIAADVSGLHASVGEHDLKIEHPTGFFDVRVELEANGAGLTMKQAALLRTVRLLMRGEGFVPVRIWDGTH